MAHRLDPLLKPSSLAVLGASDQEEAVGRVVIEQLRQGNYAGRLFAVNPNHDEVLGLTSYATLEDLPIVPEHVFFAVPNDAIEKALESAARIGVKAVTIVASLEDTRDMPVRLKERIRTIAHDAGMLLCGGNGNGFYNIDDGVWACGFRTRSDHRTGGITLITHSGSLFGALVDSDPRLDFNMAISSGQELTVTLADYMDFALEQPSTRVIGLFLESVRNPAGFVAALEKAEAKDIPVIALKVGRSETAAAMAESHSGALVGDDRVYDALFARYGVQRVATIDELAITLLLFSQWWPIGPGGLATIHDSGGERELLVDLASQEGVPFAALSPDIRSALEARLEPGLKAENPLDAWGSGRHYEAQFQDCLTLMMEDPGVAIGAMVCDRGPGGQIYPEYPAVAAAAGKWSGKPVAILSNHQGCGNCDLTVIATRMGTPVVDGLLPFLRAAKLLFAYRDFTARSAPKLEAAPKCAVERWRDRLLGESLSEHEAHEMLAAFGIQANPGIETVDLAAATVAARSLGYPLVLKTARRDLAHKLESDGVYLDLADEAALTEAYRSLEAAHGPAVLVAPMVHGGVELILGMKHDPDFGPVVVVGAGGGLAEILDDVVTAIPPFDTPTAAEMISRLRVSRLLSEAGGRANANLDRLAESVARFSVMVSALGDLADQIDINPLVALPDRTVALDALVIIRGTDSARGV